MKTLVYIVDSFAANGQGGNPAGVVLDAASLTAQQMQAIAKEVGASETAFVLPHSEATHELRFFTPVNEVDLCGHATIASWALLYHERLIKAGDYTQQTKAGRLKIKIEQNGTVSMEQAKPVFSKLVPAEEVAKLLNVGVDRLAEYSPQVVSTGLTTLVVGLKSKQDLLSLQPDLTLMSVMEEQYDFVQTHPYVLLSDSDLLASGRDFGPSMGIVEESATGTANGALLAYLNHHKLADPGKKYRLEQGESMGKLSYIYGEIINGTIWIGGQAKLAKQMEATA